VLLKDTVFAFFVVIFTRIHPGAILGKNIWGTWPLIIWEATTAKQNLSEITIEPINQWWANLKSNLFLKSQIT